MPLIFVCRTCDRNAETAPGQTRAGAALIADLHAYLESAGEDAWEVREVACLNGCLNPCNVAFRGTDRYTYRFSRIDADDMAAIVAFGHVYAADPAGEVGSDQIPPALHAKLTVRTPPPGRWSANRSTP